MKQIRHQLVLQIMETFLYQLSETERWFNMIPQQVEEVISIRQNKHRTSSTLKELLRLMLSIEINDSKCHHQTSSHRCQRY